MTLYAAMLPIAVLSWLLFASVLYADVAHEIQYANLKEVRGNDLLIRYGGPGGEQVFSCNIETEACDQVKEKKPTLFPKSDVSDRAVLSEKKSWDGRYRVEQRVVDEESCSCTQKGATEYRYVLVDVSGDVARDITALPISEKVVSYTFSLLNGHIAFFRVGGAISVYDIASQKMQTIQATDGLSYRIVSPLASYVGGYHAVSGEYRLWNMATGKRITIPAEPSGFFAEFSYDESRFSFLDHDENGHVTLFMTDLTDWVTGKRSVNRVFDETFVIADYIFLNDGLLYVIGNTEGEPYTWVLYQYNPMTRAVRRIRDDVSYGGWIRPVRERDIQFVIIEGKNSHIALYNSDRDEVQVFRPVDPSPSSKHIDRTTVTVNGIHGVLYAPKQQPEQQQGHLFVWLHGGPMRQTSLGYHSFSSYARFDELLERFVDAGSYVLKVDFTGSYGFGRPFMEDLKGQLGKADVADVVAMTEEVQQNHEGIDKTYLIGLSYGGYLGPKVLVDHQQLFDGAITVNGVFDWLIWLEEHPRADSFKKWFYGTPNLSDLEKNFSLYEEASIIKQLPDLDSDKPILILYGENDTTIVPAQSRWFFYLAKAFGKDARLLEIKNEGHVISRRESMDQICQYITDELHLSGVSCGG